jgi:hypothetical protein
MEYIYADEKSLIVIDELKIEDQPVEESKQEQQNLNIKELINKGKQTRSVEKVKTDERLKLVFGFNRF